MLKVFVPRLMDASQLNPQNRNAQEILARWNHDAVHCQTLCYGSPNLAVEQNDRVQIHSVWKGRLWLADLFRQYFKDIDLIFYPGGHWVEQKALRWRQLLRAKIPIVVTVEGLIGNEEREQEYSNWAGHRVYCQHVDDRGNRIWDQIFRSAEHVIAISPFLAEMSRRRYGDKFSVIPLGIDTSLFHSFGRTESQRVRVVSAGRVESHKRPEFMLELARKNPNAIFTWYGEGVQRELLSQKAAEQRIQNVSFPGALAPPALAECFRNSDILIMPSKSEGVPKVTQEAAACGLAQVIYGFYEAPSVIDGQNGFVVWDDEQFFERVDQLINDRNLTSQFGAAGAKLARKNWDWDQVAKQWQDTICKFLPSA